MLKIILSPDKEKRIKSLRVRQDGDSFILNAQVEIPIQSFASEEEAKNAANELELFKESYRFRKANISIRENVDLRENLDTIVA